MAAGASSVNTARIDGKELRDDFYAAVDLIRNYEGSYSPSVDEKLKFYGLFKQATEGDVTCDAPGFFRGMTARYKWEAWSKLQGTASSAAAAEYVGLLSQGWPTWRDVVTNKSGAGNQMDSLEGALPVLPAGAAAAAPATPPHQGIGSLPSTAPAAVTAAHQSSRQKALSASVLRLRNEMRANMSAMQSLEASVSKLEQRQTPVRGTPSRPSCTPDKASPPMESSGGAHDSTAKLVASVTEQTARVAAVAATGQAGSAAAAGAREHMRRALRCLTALWRRIMAMLQPMMLAAATVFTSARLQELLPALMKPLYTAVHLWSGMLQAVLTQAGLGDAAHWVKYAAEQVQGGLKALESLVPPKAGGAVIFCLILAMTAWRMKELVAQVLVWVIA